MKLVLLARDRGNASNPREVVKSPATFEAKCRSIRGELAVAGFRTDLPADLSGFVKGRRKGWHFEWNVSRAASKQNRNGHDNPSSSAYHRSAASCHRHYLIPRVNSTLGIDPVSRRFVIETEPVSFLFLSVGPTNDRSSDRMFFSRSFFPALPEMRNSRATTPRDRVCVTLLAGYTFVSKLPTKRSSEFSRAIANEILETRRAVCGKARAQLEER